MKNISTDTQVNSDRILISIHDMEDISRRAVARCVTQTASRHAGYHCLFGSFNEYTKQWIEEARWARLTHEELVNLTEEERISRFCCAFENDEKFSTDNSILVLLWSNRKTELEKYMRSAWIWQENMLHKTYMQATKSQDRSKDVIRQEAEEIKSISSFSWIRPWTWLR